MTDQTAIGKSLISPRSIRWGDVVAPRGASAARDDRGPAGSCARRRGCRRRRALLVADVDVVEDASIDLGPTEAVAPAHRAPVGLGGEPVVGAGSLGIAQPRRACCRRQDAAHGAATIAIASRVPGQAGWVGFVPAAAAFRGQYARPARDVLNGSRPARRPDGRAARGRGPHPAGRAGGQGGACRRLRAPQPRVALPPLPQPEEGAQLP